MVSLDVCFSLGSKNATNHRDKRTLNSTVTYYVCRPQADKMEDHLDEAINVLQRHASGQGGPGLTEMHNLLTSGLGLPPGLSSVLGLAGRKQGLVRSLEHTHKG